MRRQIKALRTLMALAALSVFADAVNAEYIMTIDQTGSGVTFSGNGSINTESFTTFALNQPTAALLDVQPNIAFIAVNIASQTDEYNMTDSGPASFGPGGFASGPTGSVSGFFIFQQVSPGLGAIDLPAGYVSGTALPTASATLAGATYASLGITPGNYTWTWGAGPTADSFELVVNPATPTPEPSSLVLLGTGAAFAGFGGWIRRRKVVT